MAWSQCASKASGVSQSAGSAQASGAAEPMTAEPIINKSQLALNAFVTAIREKTDDITNLLSAMQVTYTMLLKHLSSGSGSGSRSRGRSRSRSRSRYVVVNYGSG